MQAPQAKFGWLAGGHRRRGGAIILGCAALSAVLLAAPAGAQQVAPPNAQRPQQMCHVQKFATEEGQPEELRAICRGRGVLLGPVIAFEAIANEVIEATLIDVRSGTGRRIYLISFPDGDTPLLEDLSGQIALAAGRGPLSGLAGVELDLTSFGARGEIGVRGRPEDIGPGNADRIDLGQQIATERVRRQGSAARN